MITRARVLKVGVDGDHPCKLLVEIPTLDGAIDDTIDKIYGVTNDPGVNPQRWASIIYIPGINVQYNVGDIVVVGFEDNDFDYPIVLGFLQLQQNVLGTTLEKKIDSRVYGDFQEVKTPDIQLDSISKNKTIDLVDSNSISYKNLAKIANMTEALEKLLPLVDNVTSLISLLNPLG